MASPELLAKIAAKLAELNAATKPAQEAYRGINPELLKTFAMQVKSPEGKALGELMSPELVQRLNTATPVLRRKSISDLSQPQLGTVFTANKTGASAGINRSREARQDFEPAMFGGNPVYGSLTEDLKAPMDSKLSLRYPKTGNSTVLASDAVVSGYGPYGFIPKDKSKFTYTLGDSLDTGRGVSIGDAHTPADLMGGHHDNSALGALAQYFYDQRVKKILELGLNDTKYGVYAPDKPEMRALKWDDPARLAWEKEQDELMRAFNADYGGDGPVSRALNTAGVHGLPGQYSTATAQARLLPRNFGEQGLPMSPMEEQYSLDVPKYLNGKHPYGYVEIQGHGVTPDDIAQVVDYSLEPSLAVEKKLKKLGIDYNPIVPPDSILSQVQALVKANPSRAALSAKMKELGQDGIARELDYWKKPDTDLPKISTNYAAGGPVPTHNQDQMTHKRSSSQDQSTQSLTGSALQALVRGWMAETAGLPSLIEKGARYVDKYTTLNPDLRAMKSTDPVLPSGEFYREWLPGKQVGDEALTEVGGLLGGVGMGTIAKGVARAPGALSKVAQVAAANAAVPRALSAQAGVIKAPGGNWLSGSVEDALKGLKSQRPMASMLDSPETIAAWEAQNPGPKAMNQFIDKQLTRYVKNDMATERDPIRALAERGTLHFEPQETAAGARIRAQRARAGFPESGMAGTSDLAQTWEARSDNLLRSEPASILLEDRMLGNGENPHLKSNPWLVKVPPETTVSYADRGGDMQRDLGFDHLIDELRNATNPNSGLPANLLLKPESLDRVSVPQAVEHVAKINAWREAQKVEANQAVANNAATVLHKEYADAATNPKGLRWVELKKSDTLPEGWKETLAPGGWATDYTNPKGEQGFEHPGKLALKAALKYEGDTMGHCVGGYCDDVASGKSRIFSLRDAKGQPHVTIEAAPMMNRDDPYAAAERIIQIKGKSNKKPNDEYLPFVQDFVKSGKWSDVGDLQNSGLRKTSDAWNANELKKIQDAGVEVPSHATQAEIDAIGEHVWPGQWGQSQKPPAGFASGGSVTAGPWWDSYQEGPPNEQPTKTALPALTLEDFRKRISPNMLDAEGKFKAPVAGVNYMLEGLTPEQAYNTAQGVTEWSDDNRLGKFNSRQQAEELLDPNWRAGPDNGGGGLGGFVRAVGNMGTGIAHNPALMAALTAGVGSSFNPAISEGLQSVGMSANAAKTAAPMVLNAGKTVLSGGSLADAAKGAAVGYAGGEIGGAVKDTTGSDFMGNAVRTLTQTALNGGSLSIDELAAQYASGKLTDLTWLPPQVASMVVNLARNRKTTPGAMVGALSQVARKAS